MLNVVLIGGVNVDAIIESIDTEKYNIVKSHKFVMDAMDDIMVNYAEYLDVHAIVVLQPGIKDTGDGAQQIRYFQESLLVTRVNSKLYYLLNDPGLYSEIESSEEPVIHKKTRIIYLQKIFNKHIMDTIEGKMDNAGICAPEEKVEEEYTEDGLDLEEPEETLFTKPATIMEVPVEEKPKPKTLQELKNKGKEPKQDPLKELKQKEKKGFGAFGRNKDSDEFSDEPGPEPSPKVSKRVTSSGFGGILAVTGDRGSGVSTTASSIAETFAKSGKSVLLIDFDFKRRFQSVIYNELDDYEVIQPKTQMGVYYALSNPNSLEDVCVVVRDNLALLGLNRAPEYYRSPIVDRTLDELESYTRINNLLGLAKSFYDVVVIDFPLEQLTRLIETSIIIDKYVLCMENNIHLIDNLFNITFADVMGTHELYVKSILYRSYVVLTKYSSHAKYGKKEMTTKLVENLVQQAVYPKMEVAGKITYSNVFQNVGNTNKNVIDLYDTTRSELIQICENIRP